METTTIKVQETNLYNNFSAVCKAANFEMDQIMSDCWVKVAVAGITDALNIMKNKQSPVAIIVQDLKGNKIIAAVVEWIAADDATEAALGNWSYYWTWDVDSIPADAVTYTTDQAQIIKIILDRGYNMYAMVCPNTSYLSQLVVYLFNLIKDMLDQEAVEEGHEWVAELDGYFEASVIVEGGVKTFAFMPKGEMKMLIKDDTAAEK